VVPRTYPQDQGMQLIHTGTFFHDRHPGKLLEALEHNGLGCLHQFGRRNQVVEECLGYPAFRYHGLVDQAEAYGAIAGADACVIITSGEAYESTTKIFDYLAFGKKVLIITAGKSLSGSLHEITAAYPNVFWSGNSVEEIARAMQEMQAGPALPCDVSVWSRAEGLKLLVKLIRNEDTLPG